MILSSSGPIDHHLPQPSLLGLLVQLKACTWLILQEKKYLNWETEDR